MLFVVKVGTSSLVDDSGAIRSVVAHQIAQQIHKLRTQGHQVVLVSSGAIAAGMPSLGFESRPTDVETLQALAAVGQTRLMQMWEAAFLEHSVVVGQVLLAGNDFVHRRQYVQARSTLLRLLGLGVVPIINENDAVVSEEIRFGDNDRMAALVAQLVDAKLLVLLTDQAGVFTSNPRVDDSAVLIEEIRALDSHLSADTSSSGSSLGSGGMASKLTAARMAAWGGVDSVIADARRPEVLVAVAGGAAVGTHVRASERRLNSRKLWIAFAVASRGSITVDPGAAEALRSRGGSLLSVGVATSSGGFLSGDAVEIFDDSGQLVGKGLSRIDATVLSSADRSDRGTLVVHRDDLVVF